jgi:small-conductance mechanosensitive channel
MASKFEGAASRAATAGAAGNGWQRSPIVWQVLSAVLLLAMGGIHLSLVFQWARGLLGVLFVLNAIGGLVLAIAMLAARRRLLRLASLLSLLFMAGTLLALVLALTVGLFGITEQLSTALVVTTLIVESIGTVVLAVTTALSFGTRRDA